MRYFFVDLPTEKERIEIFRVHLEKRLKTPEAKGDFEITEDVLNNLSNITEGFGGAEIEQMVISRFIRSFF